VCASKRKKKTKRERKKERKKVSEGERARWGGFGEEREGQRERLRGRERGAKRKIVWKRSISPAWFVCECIYIYGIRQKNRLYKCVYIYTYMNMYIFTYICIYIYIYTNTM